MIDRLEPRQMLAVLEFALNPQASSVATIVAPNAPGSFTPLLPGPIRLTGNFRVDLTGNQLSVLSGTRFASDGSAVYRAASGLTTISLGGFVFEPTAPAMPIATNGVIGPGLASVGMRGNNNWTATGGASGVSAVERTNTSTVAITGLTLLEPQGRFFSLGFNIDAVTRANGQTIPLRLEVLATGVFIPPQSLGSIGGLLYNDANANRTRDPGEGTLAGWELYIDQDNDDILDPLEPTAVTNVNGQYRFANLVAGTYTIRQVPRAGWLMTTPTAGEHVVTLTAGQNRDGLNFGNRESSTGAGQINGVVFDDADRDGLLDVGEPRLAERVIYIDANRNNVRDAGELNVRTNASGEYVFANLAPGTYRVRRDAVPAGFTYTVPTSGVHEVVLTAGQNASNRHFGMTSGAALTGSISGAVFSDTDRDGQIDTGEPRLADRVVYIDSNRNGVRDASEPNVRTNAGGEYRFSNLAAGTYRVRRDGVPAGFVYTVPASGVHEVVLANGQNVSGRHFGNAPMLPTGTASISGILFDDVNRNGRLDSGETRLGNRTMYLDLNRNGQRDAAEPTSITSAGGEYRFANLVAGTYRVRRDAVPSGFTFSVPTIGYYDVTLLNAQTAGGLLFGMRPIV